MTEGYAARRGGDLPLFHALLLLTELERLPARYVTDLDAVRVWLDLSEAEFEAALEVCERNDWIRVIKHPSPRVL